MPANVPESVFIHILAIGAALSGCARQGFAPADGDRDRGTDADAAWVQEDGTPFGDADAAVPSDPVAADDGDDATAGDDVAPGDDIDALPTSTLTAPTAGAVLSGANVLLRSQATDDVGVAKVEFFLDAATLIANGTQAGDVWSATWSCLATPNGGHTISAVATDTNNQTTTSPSVSITVSNTTTFPATGILDDFNRADGPLGANWTYRILGDSGDITIVSQRLDVGANDTTLIWNPTAFGANQEAFATIATVDNTGLEIDLVFKAERSDTPACAMIEIVYLPTDRALRLDTTEDGISWIKSGTFPFTLVDGDVLGGRAWSDGRVEVFRNGTLVTTFDASAWSRINQGGYIGMWFVGAQWAVADDFGGGTIP